MCLEAFVLAAQPIEAQRVIYYEQLHVRIRYQHGSMQALVRHRHLDHHCQHGGVGIYISGLEAPVQFTSADLIHSDQAFHHFNTTEIVTHGDLPNASTPSMAGCAGGMLCLGRSQLRGGASRISMDFG